MRLPLLAFLADAVLVLAFVLIGRASHDENPVPGALVTYWPFAVGLVAGWLVARAWRAPSALVRTALPVWAVTVFVGLLLRVASDQGVQPGFVIVTAVVLAVFLGGWRALSRVVTTARRARTP
jgi:hypothetical protein